MATTFVDADAEWMKFMSRLTRQQNCEDDAEYDSDDNNGVVDTIGRQYSGVACGGSALMTASTTTASTTTASPTSTATRSSTKQRKSSISKKIQRRSYSFVDDTLLAQPEITSHAETTNAATTPAAAGVSKIRQLFSPIYISTKTKIAYLNKPIRIYDVFWDIPVQHYYIRGEGVIKKQIKFQTTDPAAVVSIKEKLQQQPRYYEEFIIEHIDNPTGRIPYKDQRKISIGMSRKDLGNGNNKKKRAFFNCFVVILRINSGIAPVEERAPEDDILYKEMHVKVFNTGKLEIPGIQEDSTLVQVLQLLVKVLRPLLGDDLDYLRNRCETALINSNFNCGFYIDRDRLFELLKYKYRMNCNYDSCSYPGIQSKFYYIPDKRPDEQTGQQPASMDLPYYEVSFMLFRTGSILIVGKCNEEILNAIYQFICRVLETEYSLIQMGLISSSAAAAIGGEVVGEVVVGGGGVVDGITTKGVKNLRKKKLSTTPIRFYEENI